MINREYKEYIEDLRKEWLEYIQLKKYKYSYHIRMLTNYVEKRNPKLELER